MPSIHIRNYKKNFSSLLDQVKSLSISDVLFFVLACTFVVSLLSLSHNVFLKQYIVTLLVLVSSIIGLIAAVFNDSIQFPRTKIWYTLGGFLAAVFISALVSPLAREGIIGYGTEVDTAVFIGVWVLLVALASAFVDSNKKTHKALLLLSIASAVMIFLQIVGVIFFKGNIGLSASVIEVSIFSVFILAITLVSDQFAVHFFETPRARFILALVLTIVGVSGLFIANYFLAWVIIGFVALCSVLYALIQKMQTHVPIRIPWLSIIIFFFALVGMFVGSISGQWKGGTAFNDATKPSLQSTINVTYEALRENPIFGVGPNQFAYLWDSEKTVKDIVSPIASIQYSLGFAYFPTFIATTGILGLIALVSFLVFFIGLGFSIMRKILSQRHHDTVTFLAWTMSFILLAFTLVTTPDFSILILTAITIGLALGSSFINGYTTGTPIAVSVNARRSKITLSLLTLVFLALIVMSYVTTRSVVAYTSYRSVMKLPVDVTSVNKMARIAEFKPHDVYYRGVADMYVNLLRQNIAAETENVELVRSIVQGMVASSQEAININPLNYRNLKKAGDIATILGQLQIEGAYSQAKDLYTQALEKKPYSVDVLLALAELYQVQDNATKVRNYANIAYSVSPRNPNIYITLAKLAISEENLKEATEYISVALSLQPNNGNLWLELGGLLYQQADYENAARAFTKAIEVYPVQEAYYYLGLSLKKLGRYEDVTNIYNFLKEKGATISLDELVVSGNAPAPVSEDISTDEDAAQEETE